MDPSTLLTTTKVMNYLNARNGGLLERHPAQLMDSVNADTLQNGACPYPPTVPTDRHHHHRCSNESDRSRRSR